MTSASTLSISTSGTFSTSDTATALSAPGANWMLSFDVASQPATSGVLADSFDAAFSNFHYSLNGSPVSEVASSVRFYDIANEGLFTVFFGPESGILNGGGYTPEFSFYGPQLFSGSVTGPSILTGSFSVSESIFSDAENYDDQFSPATTVLVSASAVPEPATFGMLAFPFAFAAVVYARRTRRSARV